MKKLLVSAFALFLSIGMFAQETKSFPTLPENVSVKTLDGKTVQTSTFNNDGKPYILSFWATWCKPCLRELNTIKEVYEDWQEETGVKIIAVSIDDARGASRVKPLVNGSGWEYEVYIDQNQDLKRAMNVVNVPHTFIINGKGEVVWQHTSFVEGSEEELIELENQLIELESMTGLDYLLILQENNNKSSFNLHGIMDNVGSAVETVSKFIPAKGISEIGKLSGKLIKSFGKNKK